MIRKITLASFLFSLIFVTSSVAQTETTADEKRQMRQAKQAAKKETKDESRKDAFNIPVINDDMTKDPDQNSRWRAGDYAFSAKPKNAWEVGIHAGHLMINGDVHRNLLGGYGLGLHLRRAISYTFSMRMDLYYGQYKGYDVRESTPAVMMRERFYQQGSPETQSLINGYAAEGRTFVRTHETKVLGGSLQAIVNLGNILFHQERNKWGLYGLVGAGLYSPSVKLNVAGSQNSLYDFSGTIGSLDATKKDDRKEIKDRIKDLLDDDFETDGAYENRVALFGDDKDILPSFHVGIGLSRKLGKRVNLTLEHQTIISDTDLLDGFEFRTTEDETNNRDFMNYTNLRININLGNFNKRTEPLYWMNPLAPGLEDMRESKLDPVLDLTDTDGDGVIDMLDAEINSPEGCAVDTRGIVLDSDDDGIIDCKDQEKFSPPGYPIDERGVAIIPPGPIPLTEDDVNAIVNNKIANIPQREWWLPMIHFDLDKYYIKPEFYAQMKHIASVLKGNGDVNLVVRGHTDVRNPGDYNRVLSYNRAKAAINYLVEKHGIPRERLILQYGGEDEPMVDGLPESHAIPKNKEHHQYLNRRVEFSVAKPGDASMGRPEGPEAGQGTPGSSRSGSKFSGNSNSGY